MCLQILYPITVILRNCSELGSMPEKVGNSTFELRIRDICNEIVTMLVKKNADYGDSNLLEDGLLGIGIRMKDKVNRVINLSKRGGVPIVEDETVRDTLKDWVGYTLNAIRLLDEGRLTWMGGETRG